jgi:hypothetical protein
MGAKNPTCTSKHVHALTTNYSTERHWGNRGLNTQQIMREMETRCVGKQDKTNGK